MKKGSQQSKNVPMTTPSVTKALCSLRQEELRRLRSLRTENTENNIVNVDAKIEENSGCLRTFWNNLECEVFKVLPNLNFCFCFPISDTSRQYQQSFNQPGGTEEWMNIQVKKFIIYMK